LMHSKV